jgi:hypothetical protein
MAKRYSRDNPYAPPVEPVAPEPTAAPTGTGYSADNPFARASAPAPDVSLGQDVADVLRTAVGQGAAMGFGDEIEAAARAPFSDRTYAEIRDDVRAQNTDFGRRHPVLAPTLEIAGAVGSAFIPGLNVAGAAKGATALGRIGRAAATGAALGAASGIGKDESGTAGGMAASAAGGAAGGFLGGAALQGAGEAVRAGWQATQAGARVLDVAEHLAPARSLKDALARQAQAQRDKATNRYLLSGIVADGRTPGGMAQVARDLPESIPVSTVDLGGENLRQRLGAIKRLPGPGKEQVAATVKTREENLPTIMRESVARNLQPVGPDGVAPASLDNPTGALKTARRALAEKGERLYEPVMEQDAAWTPERVETMARLSKRPSVRRARGYAEEMAAESDDPIGTVPLVDRPPVFGPDGEVALPARGARVAREAPAAPPLGTAPGAPSAPSAGPRRPRRARGWTTS